MQLLLLLADADQLVGSINADNLPQLPQTLIRVYSIVLVLLLPDTKLIYIEI